VPAQIEPSLVWLCSACAWCDADLALTCVFARHHLRTGMNRRQHACALTDGEGMGPGGTLPARDFIRLAQQYNPSTHALVQCTGRMLTVI
jgi:hypothetical protein